MTVRGILAVIGLVAVMALLWGGVLFCAVVA